MLVSDRGYGACVMQLNWRIALIAATAGLFPQVTQSAEIKVIAANALKDGYSQLVASFEKTSGHKIMTTWTGTVNATKRVGDGEVYDLVIIGSSNIDQLIAAGKLVAGSRADFAKRALRFAPGCQSLTCPRAMLLEQPF
jgi:molybdate transport system substrate-binding protein